MSSHSFRFMHSPFYKTRIEVIGIPAFCLINMIPNLAVVGVLLYEVLRTSPTPRIGFLQVTVMLAPGMGQAILEGWGHVMNMRHAVVPDSDVVPPDTQPGQA